MAEQAYTVASDGEAAGDEKSLSPFPEIAIGIDIGTYQCSLAVWNGSEVDLLRNMRNQKLMLSYVSFKGRVPVGGVSSQIGNAHEMLTGATIFNMKRLIGRVDTDPVVHASKYLPFLVQSLNIGVRPFVAALVNHAWSSTTPEEVLAIYLVELKSLAEFKLKRPVHDVVLTIPVAFNRFQMSRIERVCAMAGLKVVRLMPEPTAVALLYSQQQLKQNAHNSSGSTKDKNVLIFNMGAGFCDVAVASVSVGMSHIEALAGEPMGGEDILMNTMRHLLPEMDALFSAHGIEEIHKLGLLRVATQDAIHKLSSNPEAQVNVNLGDGKTINKVLDRKEFEQANQEVFDKCSSLITQCLLNTKLRPENIDDVVLVGGCSNIPKIREILTGLFKPDLYTGIDPLEGAVCGAALEGALTSGADDPSGILELLTIQATPLSIGIRANGNSFVPFIHKNSPIPIRRELVFTTVQDNQSEVLIVVYEGNEEELDKKHLLGYFKISGIPAAKKGVPEINVCMDIDATNKLRVVGGVMMRGETTRVRPFVEVRMPLVDDGHGWCAEALTRIQRSSLDLVTLNRG